MKYLLSVLCLVFAVGLIGCGNSESVPVDQGGQTLSDNLTNLTEVKVGSQWTYLVQDFADDGSLVSQDTLIRLIRKATTFSGHTAFEVSENGDTTGDAVAYYDGSDDLYFVQAATSTTPQVTWYFHYTNPIGVNIPFYLRDTMYINAGDTMISRQVLTLINSNESVTTPGGTFACKHLRRSVFGGPIATPVEFYTSDFYCKLGTGIVLQVDSSRSNTTNMLYLQSKKSLIKYELK
ncbi:MAG TPA: hypothetical protein VFO76_08055 [Candidatus Kapabacteria bacterium]|nr:hypothetical protein [Candidatus Kapabacteria bacterium]